MERRLVLVVNDQVPRLERFRAQHPGIQVKTPVDTRSAWWTASRDGEQLAAELDLRHLLNALETRLSS